MSNRPMPKVPEGVLTDEQVAKINGGECTAGEITTIVNQLQENYNTLVDFTSYVIERVVGQ